MAFTSRFEHLIGIIKIFQSQYSSPSLMKEWTFNLTAILQDMSCDEPVDTLREQNYTISATIIDEVMNN